VAGSAGLACSEPTAPREPLVVTLTSRTFFGPILGVEGEDPTIGCGFRVEVGTTGRGHPVWHSAVLRFFAGADRGQPLDSIIVGRNDLDAIWPIDTLTLLRPSSSEWELQARVPFEVEFAFGYTPRGATEPTFVDTRAACGPVPSATSAAATTSLVEVRTSDPELNVGDTVFVTYDAASASGLWRSGVSLSGPFDRTEWRPDTLLSASRHTVAFVVPVLSRLDLPLSVLLIADDIAFRRTTSLHATPIRVFDRVRPVASAYAAPADVPTGTSISFSVSASDDNAVRAIVWELDGGVPARDSIVLASPVNFINREFTVQVPAAWAGMQSRLRVRAYDDAGQVSTEYQTAPATFRFHETFSVPIDSSRYPVTTAASSWALDVPRARLYSALQDDSRIVVTDVSSMTERAVIAVAAPGPLALSRTGDTLLVASGTSRTVRFVNPTTGAVFSTIRLSALDSIMAPDEYSHILPNWMGVTVAGHLLVHLSFLRGVVDVDLATGAQSYRREFERPVGGLVAEVTPDGERVLLIGGECQNWYIVATDSLTACGPATAGYSPRIHFGASLGRIGVGRRILGPDLVPIGPSGRDGFALPDPDGVHHWMVSEGRLYKVRTVDGVTARSMALPGGAYRVRWASDAPVLLMGWWGSVQKIDLTGR